MLKIAVLNPFFHLSYNPWNPVTKAKLKTIGLFGFVELLDSEIGGKVQFSWNLFK
jgi:hypothetical protein